MRQRVRMAGEERGKSFSIDDEANVILNTTQGFAVKALRCFVANLIVLP
jgi:hypothetical protein